MLDSEQVISQVQQGNIPADWQVTYGKPSNKEARTIITRSVLSAVLGILLIALSGFKPSPLLLLGIICLGFMVLTISRGLNTLSELPRLAVIARNTFIVLMPQGVVMCYAANDPELREVNTIDYIRVQQIAEVSRKTIEGIGLDITQRDGNTGLLNLELFPNQAQLAQAIMTAHERFLVTLRQ